MNLERCLGAAVVLLLLTASPNPSSPVGRMPLVGAAFAQAGSQGNNETGWGNFSVTITSSNETFTWVGEYTLAACAQPPVSQSGQEVWESCGDAIANLDGTTSGVACDPDYQYLWSVYVLVGYNDSSPSLQVGLKGPIGGEIALGCGAGNNYSPPALIPTYCCNESGLAVSSGVLSGVATYSATGTDASELPGFTVRWSGAVSVNPTQVTTSTTPEFNANALAFVVIVPLAVVALITRRVVRKAALEYAKDG